MSDIVFSRLWSVSRTRIPEDAYRSLKKNGAPEMIALLDSILLNQVTYFPTSSYVEFIFLERLLGLQNILDLVERGRLVFVFVPHNLGYNQRYGLCDIAVADEDANRPRESWKDPQAAIEQLISVFNNKALGRIALEKLASHAQNVEFSREQLTDVFEYTKREYLSALRLLAPGVLREINSLELPSNKMYIYGGGVSPYSNPSKGDIENTMQLYLSFAYSNLELAILERLKVDQTSSSFMSRIQSEVKKPIVNRTFGPGSALAEIRDVGGIPNISDLVVRGKMPVASFFELVNGRNADEFRKWINCDDLQTREAVLREYVGLVRDNQIAEGLGAKLVRFLILELCGVSPILSHGSNVLGGFGLPVINGRSRTRLFLERMRKKQWSPPARKDGSFETKI